MSDQIKLEAPGDNYTMKLAEVVYDTSGQFPAMLWYDEIGNYIKMSGKTGQDKLKRLNWTVQSVNALAQKEAVWLTFSRAENPNPGQSAYWNVALASTRPATTRTPPPAAKPADRASTGQPAGTTGTSSGQTSPAKPPIGPIYLECLEFVLDQVWPRMLAAEKQGYCAPPDAADILSATATLFIRTEKQPGSLMPKPVQSRRPANERTNEPPPPSDEDFDPQFAQGGDDEEGYR